MKNYRSFRRYEDIEWEEDVDWLGHRLQFLWDMQKYYIDIYLKNELSSEKNDFYIINDDDVAMTASELDDYSPGEFERYEKLSTNELRHNYARLKKLKENNPQEFIRKCNCNLYCYIVEQKREEISEL